MPPSPVTSTNKTAAQQRIDAIYYDVRYKICTNRYPPDTVLYEEILAKEYDVSRTPIRRVFSKLEHEGLIEIKHGIGTIVTHIELGQLLEVYAVRLILAKSMGQYIETPFTSETRDFFLQCRDDFKALEPGDAIGFAETNIRYYTKLTGLVQNRTMRELQLSLFFQTSRMWLHLLPNISWNETIEDIEMEIMDIVHQIDTNDPLGLGYVARNHIFKSRQWLFDYLPTP